MFHDVLLVFIERWKINMKISVLNDIEKNFEDYLLKENVHVMDLLKCITNVYMECGNQSDICELNDHESKIVTSMKDLSLLEQEVFFEYVLKEINDFNKEIECILHCIPDDKTADFTKKINRYLKVKDVIDDNILKKIIESNESDNITKFKAYYIMFTFHHSKKDVHVCKEIVDRYEIYFSSYPLWYYTKSQMLFQEERERKSPDISKALEAAKKCITIYEDDRNDYNADYPGIYHNFCELVFYAYDELGDKNSFLENLEFAKNCIENAIRINENYAKYYYTKGRLLMAESSAKDFDQYDEAKHWILQAIDKEDSSNKNYALKMIDYEIALLRCKTEQKLRDICKRAQEK